MFDFLKKLFGNSPAVDFKQLVKDGAVIVDVRSPGEYQQGHLKPSVNIPLEKVSASVQKYKNKTVITVCRSGARSRAAQQLFQQNQVKCYNGGGWQTLQRKLQAS